MCSSTDSLLLGNFGETFSGKELNTGTWIHNICIETKETYKHPCQFLWMQFFFLPQTKKKHSKNSNIMKYYYNLWYLKKMCAVKWLIAINRIQNKKCLHNTCVCTVYIYYVYINTQRFMYIFKKNMLLLYIKYIYIRYNLYEYKYTCTYFQKICCMCLSL